MKSSPSVDPRSHLASVRSEGWVSFGAIGPFPFASAPWQNRQFFVNAAWPAATESADEGTGFLSFFPSSLPPGFWALTATIATSATPKPNITDEKKRRICPKSPDSLEKACLVWKSKETSRDSDTALGSLQGGPSLYCPHCAHLCTARGRTSVPALHDDRDRRLRTGGAPATRCGFRGCHDRESSGRQALRRGHARKCGRRP